MIFQLFESVHVHVTLILADNFVLMLSGGRVGCAVTS
jgi:hypothetical protein